MQQFKQQGVNLLRRLHLLTAAEWARLSVVALRNRRDNITFLREHPDFVPPPVTVLYDAHGTDSYRWYVEGGKNEARLINDLIREHHPNANNVLEWGCGPARVLRQLRTLLPPDVKLYGSDYNATSMQWCKRNISGITFAANNLSPPLHFNEKFDVIYAISVLTHLSAAQQEMWVKELRRNLQPGGRLILTSHGERSALALLPQEQAAFAKDGIVIRSGIKEGKRAYVSYTHPRFMREKLFGGMEICQHIADNPVSHQDIWIVKEA